MKRPKIFGRVVALVLPLAVLSAGIMTMGADPIGGLAMLRSGSNAIFPEIFENLGIGGSVDVRKIGVVADGETDNSAALQAALNDTVFGFPRYSGFVFRATPQPYMLHHVDITRPVHIEIQTGATVKSHHVPTANNYMFSFQDGAEGSVFDGGGICDGNRDVLTPLEPAPAIIQGCFESRNTRISARDITMQNFVMYGFSYNDCDPGNFFGPLTIKDSGLGFFGYTCNGASIDVTAENIGPTGTLSYYQHPITIFGQNHTKMRLLLDGWSANANNRDPFSVGVTLGADGPGNDYTIDAHGFTGTSVAGGTMSHAIKTTGAWASKYNFTASGSVQNLRLEGMMYSVLTAYSDGEYVVDPVGNPTVPIWFGKGLHQYTNVTTSSADTNAVLSPRGNHVVATGIRGNYNEIVGGEDNDITLYAEGNRAFGLKVTCTVTNQIFIPPTQCTDHTTLHLHARFNGNAGLYSSGFRSLTLASDHDLSDNGQLGANAIGGLWRSGIMIDDTQAPVGDLLVQGKLIAKDTQNWVHADAISFQPGTTDINNEYVFTTTNPEKLGLGQYIKLVNATGTGDVTGKIVDIHMVTGRTTNGPISALNYPVDAITVQFDAPVTFSSTSNLTPLTGTATSNGAADSTGQFITMTGGAVTSEISGHMWITDGTQWRRVARATNDTTIVTDTPFSPGLNGATLSKLVIDVQGIPSQNYGIAFNNTTQTGSLQFGGFATAGNLFNPYFRNANIFSVSDTVTFRGGPASIPIGSSLYVGAASADVDPFKVVMLNNVMGMARSLSCKAVHPPGTGQTITCTLWLSGSLISGISCQIADTNDSCLATMNSVALNPNDLVAAYVVSSAGTVGANYINWTLDIDPTQ